MFAKRVARTAVRFLLTGRTVVPGSMEDALQALKRHNYRRARWILRDLAEAGDIHAQKALAHMYWHGVDYALDEQEAIKWWTLAGAQGDVEVQVNLGFIYNTGAGDVPQSDELSARWFGLAAKQGDELAQFLYGQMLYEGRGVNKNYKEAYRWFRLTAPLGNGRDLLGDMHLKGHGVKKSKRLAYMWYCLAAELGSDEVSEKRDQLASTMTAGELTHAEAMVARCKASNYAECG